MTKREDAVDALRELVELVDHVWHNRAWTDRELDAIMLAIQVLRESSIK
jgi:hypothetical protein